MRKEPNFATIESNQDLIPALRILGRICRKQDNGSQTDDIVDVLMSSRKLGNYRQHKNSNVYDFSRSYLPQYNAHKQIAGNLPFGTNIMQKVIDNGVGGGMTIAKYFDQANHNNDDDRIARRDMNEA